MIDVSQVISILTKKMSLDAHLAFVMGILKNAIETKAMEDVRLNCISTINSYRVILLI